MASSIFRNHPDNRLKDRARALSSLGPSGPMFRSLYDADPSFRAFADSVRGKGPERAFRDNGLDFSDFRDLQW